MAGEFVILADISNTVPLIHSITMICAAVILVPLVIKGARRLLVFLSVLNLGAQSR